MLSTSVSKYDKTTIPTEVIKAEASKLDDALAEIKIKYHTCLWRGVPKGKHVTRYDSHCAGASMNGQMLSLAQGSKAFWM